MNALTNVIAGLMLGAILGTHLTKQTETYQTGQYVLEQVHQCGDCSIATAMMEVE